MGWRRIRSQRLLLAALAIAGPIPRFGPSPGSLTVHEESGIVIYRTPAHPVPIALVVLSVMGLVPVPEASEQAVIEVTIREGTNMAAALSPDGQTLAIDALGRIWTLPATGGTAIALTDPEGDARQPSWSPDGTRIAFQAYWAGDYDVWAVNADGSGLAQITSGPFDDREPHWSPDGSSIAFSSDRSGTYDIWEVALVDGEARRLTNGGDNEYGPAYSPAGDAVAYVTDGTSTGVWIRSSLGDTERVADTYSVGSSLFGVSWSPDGSRLSYNVQSYGSSQIRIVPVSPNVGSEQILSDVDEDVFPFRASWQGSQLVYTADGQIRARLATGGAASEIPFEATVTLERPTYRKALRDFDDSSSKAVHGIVSPAVAPGGDRVAFAALGDLWVMPIGGDPVRLTDDAYVETDPTWSPDGSRLAYASDRSGMLQIWVHNVESGEMQQVTNDGGGVPVWSPDASEIAYVVSGGRVSDIRIISLSTNVSRTVRSGLNNPGRVSWSPDGEQLAVSAHWRYSTRFREGVNKALLISLGRVAAQDADDTADVDQESMTQGGSVTYTPAFSGDVEELPEPFLQTNERWLEFFPHGSVGTRSTDGPVWSPNGRLMAYVSTGVLWVIPVTPSGDPIGPPRRLTNELADDPTWAGDSESIVYLTTDRLRRVWLTDGRIEDIPVALWWQRSTPTGRVVVHAGALFDGVSESLHRNIDIVIDGNRIVRVDPHDEALHVGEIVDATDGVVSPGLIEMHTHGDLASGEQLGRTWLSYGITSIRIPAGDPYDVVEARESIGSGRRIGPRIFGTGGTIDGSRIYYSGAPSLASSAQVALEMERAAALRYDLVKTYVRLPDAVQRRVITEAHALGMPVTSHELYPAVANGADGVEHVSGTSRRGYSTKVTALNRSYQDVVQLLAQSGMTITPTVGISGGYALVTVDDPSLFDDPRVTTFSPSAPQAVRLRGDLETSRRLVQDMASTLRRVVEAGGVVVMGTDSPINPQGLSLITEMEALVRYGGMSTIDAMRATTSISAAAMGYGREFGSVRPGMLADLVVFGGNPLENIRAARDVRTVVKDGRIFELDQLLQGPSR